MKNVFEGSSIAWNGSIQQGSMEIEDRSIETSQTNKQREEIILKSFKKQY